MEHGQITVRLQGEVTDDGSNSEFIGAKHQTDDKNHKPAKIRLSGEAGLKGRQDFINKIEHGIWSTTEKYGKLISRITLSGRKVSRSNRFYAWKGYDFDILNELDDADYIRQGKHSSRSKSVYITESGMEQAKELLSKYGISEWKPDPVLQTLYQSLCRKQTRCRILQSAVQEYA